MGCCAQEVAFASPIVGGGRVFLILSHVLDSVENVSGALNGGHASDVRPN